MTQKSPDSSVHCFLIGDGDLSMLQGFFGEAVTEKGAGPGSWSTTNLSLQKCPDAKQVSQIHQCGFKIRRNTEIIYLVD